MPRTSASTAHPCVAELPGSVCHKAGCAAASDNRPQPAIDLHKPIRGRSASRPGDRKGSGQLHEHGGGTRDQHKHQRHQGQPDACASTKRQLDKGCGRLQVLSEGFAAEWQGGKGRAYLEGKGIPTGVISTQAFGESAPRVETADGVRELQNRRVEITYGPGSGM